MNVEVRSIDSLFMYNVSPGVYVHSYIWCIDVEKVFFLQSKMMQKLLYETFHIDDDGMASLCIVI